MQQRRVRLGDILDDYCPRERRITNHAVVAMIDDQVKQTRCTTCQADHEYKAAKVPPPRRRKTGALTGEEGEGVIRPRAAAPVDGDIDASETDEAVPAESAVPDESVEPPLETASALDAPDDSAPAEAALMDEYDETPADSDESGAPGEEWPVHRRLIRATLPRPEGQVPERKAPDFTFRPGGGNRFDANRNGKRGHRPMRQGQGHGHGQGQGQGHRQGAGQQRHGTGHGPQGQRQGNRPGQGGGGNRPGQGRGPRQGSGGGGRKRGR